MTNDVAPASGRLLGLDVGEKRIGVAISDPDQRLAVPLRAIERRQHDSELDDLRDIVRAEEIGALVVGLPLSLSGESGPQAERTKAYADKLAEALALPVVMWDERLSTLEASRMMPAQKPGRSREQRNVNRGQLDTMAATVILQAYLDSRRVAHAS